MDVRFSSTEARVIGCLMEKSVLTPDQYPLSLNALTNACNQKSSREPVLSLDAGAVQHAVNDLVAAKHVMVQNFGSRVDKYQQRFCNTQFAVIQSAGSPRSRRRSGSSEPRRPTQKSSGSKVLKAPIPATHRPGNCSIATLFSLTASL